MNTLFLSSITFACNFASLSAIKASIGRVVIALLLTTTTSAFTEAIAQGFPTQPLRLIVPYSPGGPSDTVARPLEQGLREFFGKAVVVEHKAGANTILGADLAARAKPDGHTLLLATVGTLAINPAGYKSLPYDVVKDFDPVSLVASNYHVIVARNEFAPKSLTELIAYAKANPGRITYGTTGIGSSIHLLTLLLETTAGVKFNHVPYKGSSDVVTALLGNQVDFSPLGPATAPGLIKQGRLKAIVATAPKRFASYPEVQTMAEAGYPSFASSSWYCVVTRSGAPVQVVSALNNVINKTFQQSSVKAPLEAAGMTVEGGMTSVELGKFIGEEMRKWSKIIKDANIQFE